MVKPLRTTKSSLNIAAFHRFIKRADQIARENGGDHHHRIEIEPQRVATLGLFRMVHEKPLSAEQYNELAQIASEAGMYGTRTRVDAANGRNGSIEFRFDGSDEKLISRAFKATHGRKSKTVFEEKNGPLQSIAAVYKSRYGNPKKYF